MHVEFVMLKPLKYKLFAVTLLAVLMQVVLTLSPADRWYTDRSSDLIHPAISGSEIHLGEFAGIIVLELDDTHWRDGRTFPTSYETFEGIVREFAKHNPLSIVLPPEVVLPRPDKVGLESFVDTVSEVANAGTPVALIGLVDGYDDDGGIRLWWDPNLIAKLDGQPLISRVAQLNIGSETVYGFQLWHPLCLPKPSGIAGLQLYADTLVRRGSAGLAALSSSLTSRAGAYCAKTICDGTISITGESYSICHDSKTIRKELAVYKIRSNNTSERLISSRPSARERAIASIKISNLPRDPSGDLEPFGSDLAKTIERRLVLIGGFDRPMDRPIKTPIGEMPGTYVAANQVLSFMEYGQMDRPHWAIETLLALVLGVVAVFLNEIFKKVVGSLLTVVVMTVLCSLLAVGVARYGFWLNLAIVPMIVGTLYVIADFAELRDVRKYGWRGLLKTPE